MNEGNSGTFASTSKNDSIINCLNFKILFKISKKEKKNKRKKENNHFKENTYLYVQIVEPIQLQKHNHQNVLHPPKNKPIHIYVI